MTIQTFQISDDLFWGWKTQVNLDNFETTQEIIEYIKICLSSFLLEHNLEVLAEKLKEKTYFIPCIEEIISSREPIIYVCNHSHS